MAASRWHLRRALREGLGHDDASYVKVCEAIATGEWSQVEEALRLAERRAPRRKRAGIRKLQRYLQESWEGIRHSEEARSLGAIEGQVFYHVSRRMKRHGGKWSALGADHLARLLSADANGELRQLIRRPWRRDPELSSSTAAMGLIRQQKAAASQREDLAAWLQARMPALYGPHAGRGWASYVLRRLAQATQEIA